MSASTLILDLQTTLGRDDLTELNDLIDHSMTIDHETSRLVSALLENYISEELIEKREESEFNQVISYLSKLLGVEGNLVVAKLFYRMGLVSRTSHYFTEAHLLLEQLYAHDSSCFSAYAFWADVLVTLGQQMHNESFIEEGLDLYAKAFAKDGESGELLWNWALGWRALYDFSYERSDIKQAIDLFKRAEKKGVSSSYFLLGFGLCYERQALATGDPSTLCKAMRLFRKALGDQEVGAPAWEALAQAQYHLALLTDSHKEFERAELLFEEAIAACPSLAQLWLLWGRLLLRVGWRRGKVQLLEGAIEKLTALKTSEINPVLVTASLGEALMALGVLVDDGRLIHEGADRISKVLEHYPDESSLLLAKAFSYLAKGLYFSDSNMLAKAVDGYLVISRKEGDQIDAWYGLFESYLHWGEQTKNLQLLKKSYKAVTRLIELRPFSPLLLTASAEVLLLQYRNTPGMKNPGRIIETAIGQLKKSLAIREEFEAQFQLARAWDALGDVTADAICYERAVLSLEKLYSKLPTDIRVVAYLGIALMHLGERTYNTELLFRAVNLFEKALEHDNENGILLERTGYCKLLLSSMATDPNHPKEGDGWRSSAEGYLKRAALFGCHDAYYHLACLYSITGYFEHALDALRQADLYGALPALEILEHAFWLEDLRETHQFQSWFKGVTNG